MTFNEWLTKKIQETGLSYSELARRGGTSHSRISQVLAGETPGADFCVKIARALGESPEYVLRLAGILDPPPARTELTVEDMVRDLWLAQRKESRKARQGLQEQPVEYAAAGDDKARPDLEDIMEIVRQLDELELQMVYDYARFRHYEQQHRRNSSHQRQVPEEEELLRLVTNLSPEARKNVLQYLFRQGL